MNTLKEKGRRIPARVFFLLVAVACAIWTFFPPPPAWVEEHYSRGLYRFIQAALVPLMDLFPFSLSGAGLLLLGLGLLGSLPWTWRRFRMRGVSRCGVVKRWCESLAMLLVLGYASFLFLWGAGYRRERLEERLNLDVTEVNTEEVSRWVSGLTHIIEQDIPSRTQRDGERALRALRESLERVVMEWDGSPPTLPSRVKRLPPGLLIAAGTAGVTSFLLEPHVDGGETEVAFLSISAHELSHVAGYCAEADADLLAAVAGLRASDPYARYSMALRLFRDFAIELPAKTYGAAFEELPEQAKEDIHEMDRITDAYRVPQLASVQRKIYDSYLRSQGLKEGVREYSFIVKLLIALERRGFIHATLGSN